VEEGITIGGHSIREHLEATNHAGAYDLLRQLTERGSPITIEIILQLHALVLHDLNPTAGQFRQQPVYVRGSDLITPHHSKVPELMRQWVIWVNQPATLHPVVHAAIAHHGFVAVHLFEDGNGRCARLLLNMHLLREGYAPAFLLRDWKGRYLAALGPLIEVNTDPLSTWSARLWKRALTSTSMPVTLDPMNSTSSSPSSPRVPGMIPTTWVCLLGKESWKPSSEGEDGIQRELRFRCIWSKHKRGSNTVDAPRDLKPRCRRGELGHHRTLP